MDHFAFLLPSIHSIIPVSYKMWWHTESKIIMLNYLIRFKWAAIEHAITILVNFHTQQDGRGKKMAKLVWQSVTIILFETIFCQTLISLKQIFSFKDQKTLYVKWQSRQNMHLIALSRLSHTSVLPSSSSYRPVA